MTLIRTYRELRQYDTFEARFEYLRLNGSVGHDTFGFDRHVNQSFYHSAEWRSVRRDVIARDNGCDLGILGHEIYGELLVHHMNPLSLDDLVYNEQWVLDTEYLITTTQNTHNAIHFGDRSMLRLLPAERKAGDTRLW
jgi:hypothetical protein